MDENIKKPIKPIMLCMEKKYYQVRSILINTSKEPDDDLKVEFSQPKDSLGWIHIDIKTSSGKITIESSDVFDPYFEFVWWMDGVLYNHLPIGWDIDEEGNYKECFVYAVDSKYLRFVVIEENELLVDDWNENSILIDTVVTKYKFIKEFYLGFKNFVKNRYYHDKWRGSDLRVHLKRLDKKFARRDWDYIHTYCDDREHEEEE